jgi:hypothetical protein
MDRHASESTRSENVAPTDGGGQPEGTFFLLEDERLCLCGHLEADHRIDGQCGSLYLPASLRCGCREFDPGPDAERTAPDLATTAELAAELAARGAR